MEEALKAAKKGERSTAAVPPDTQLDLKIVTRPDRHCLEFELFTNNDTVIKSVAIFALDGGVFEVRRHAASA